MLTRRTIFILFISLALVIAATIPSFKSMQWNSLAQSTGLIAGRNVNMVSGTDYPGGDPWLNRQNEPSIAVSSRSSFRLFAASNDYRSLNVDPDEALPGQEIIANPEDRDAWIGVYQSHDGGQSWSSRLLPGYWVLYEGNNNEPSSPLLQYDEDGNPVFTAAADPVVRAGTNGLFYLSAIAFNRAHREGNVVFVSRYIDRNDIENADTIHYWDTNIVWQGEDDEFIDKPWIAVDSPHGVGQTITVDGQEIPKSNVYLAYTVFTESAASNSGSAESSTLQGKIFFQRSTDCGDNWDLPVEISLGHDISQGATIAVDPQGNRQLVVPFRRFNNQNGQDDAIFAAISTNGGRDFDRVVEVASFPPGVLFDQITKPENPLNSEFPVSFRTNSYPTATIDGNGVIYVVWSQRGNDGFAELMISTSNDVGLHWTVPKKALRNEPNHDGHKFMPAITFAAGKVMLLWYDQRADFGTIYNDWVEDTEFNVHTIDVRASVASPSARPSFSRSIQVSRYPWVFNGNTAEQLQDFKPNLKLFNKSRWAFDGDYIDITPSPSFIPKNNSWVFNKNPNPETIFHGVWTDNRDVFVPGSGIMHIYEPPGAGCNNPDYAGVRNQNIYTARISEGIIAGSPGNTKPLDIKRAFVVVVRNTSGDLDPATPEPDPKTVRLEVDSSSDTLQAKFWEAGVEYDSLELNIPPYSSISTTVLVEANSNPYAQVIVNVIEGGNVVSQVLLNPDRTNPEIQNPYENPSEYSIHDAEVHTPHIVNYWTYDEVNPHIVNYDLENPHIVNSDMVTPHIVNTNPETPHIVNPHIVNPHIVNFAPPDDSEGSDTIWTIENNGNTLSSYSLGTFPVDIPEGIIVQILVAKVYTTPSSLNCDLVEEEHHQLITNVVNPHIVNTNPDASGVNQSESDDIAIDFSLNPGERGYVIYRVYNTDPDNIDFDPESLIPEVIADAPAVINGNIELPTAAMVITTSSLDDGITNQSYSAQILAFGGTEVYTWSLQGAPSGIVIDSSSGLISGSTNSIGIFNLVVTATDTGTPQQAASQNLTLRIVEELEINPIELEDGVKGMPIPETTFSAIGGTGSYSWSLESDATWLAIDESTGALSGIPDEAGDFPFAVHVTDTGNPPQTATLEDLVFHIVEPLTITTEFPPNGVNGVIDWDYNFQVEATGGIGDYTWTLSGAPEWMIISDLGEISRDPGVTMTAGHTENIIVRVEDEFSPEPLWDEKSFTATIYATLDIKTTTLEAGFVGMPYTVTLNVEGGLEPFEWRLDDESPPLPDGLELSEDGEISGTPVYDPEANYPETYTFTVYVEDYFVPPQTDTQELTLTINPKEEFWEATPDVSGETEASAIALDSEGNIYVVGKVIDTGSGSDLYVAKFDKANGVMLWDESVDFGYGNDEAKAIATDTAGSYIYVTGFITGESGDTNIFTVKFNKDANADGSGDPVWSEEFDGGFGDDKPSAITVDGEGNVYVTGFSMGRNSGEDYVTIKYDSDGNFQWSANYDGPSHLGDRATAIAVAAVSGNVYVTGYSYRGNKWEHSDYLTVKYDNEGESVWEERYDGRKNGNDEAKALCLDQQENVYITGRSEQDLGGGAKDYDYYTIKYNSSGRSKWEVRYDGGNGHDEAIALAINSTGLYVTGFSTGVTTGADYYTVKYNLDNGQVLGEQSYDGESGEDQATGLALNSSGVFVTGWSKLNTSNYDFLTLKYSLDLTSTLWEARYDNGDNADKAIAIAVDSSSNVYVTGFTLVGSTSYIVTVKY